MAEMILPSKCPECRSEEVQGDPEIAKWWCFGCNSMWDYTGPVPEPPAERCEKCKQHPLEYESPGKWCRRCWAEWWCDDGQENVETVLAKIQRKFGDPPK